MCIPKLQIKLSILFHTDARQFSKSRELAFLSCAVFENKFTRELTAFARGCSTQLNHGELSGSFHDYPEAYKLFWVKPHQNDLLPMD